jgi:hypothetical protein
MTMNEPYDDRPDSYVYKEPELEAGWAEPSAFEDAFGGSDEL